MKNFFLLILMIGLVWFMPSCSRYCKSGSYYNPIANQLKKYSFEPGSYWIYQDSASGIIDSQTVYNYSTQSHVQYMTEPIGDGSWCDYYDDVFFMSVASFWNGVTRDSIAYTNSGTGTEILMVYPFNSIQNAYGYPADGYYTDTLTNFSVLGQTFPKVYRDKSNYNALLYHVDNVGMVKWVFNDTINGQHTWNLLRYHVINP